MQNLLKIRQGGKWSFDTDNRKNLPKNVKLPKDISFETNFDLEKTKEWLDTVPAEKYGEIGCWLPYTHKEAETYLQVFLNERFALFGTYEDALSTHIVRLFHSTLSPLINIGLLEPMQVLEAALHYADG